MTRQLTVLGLGGSTRKGSWAEALLRKALINSRSLGMRPQLYPLAAKDLPVFRESLLLDPPPVVAELLTKARQTDVLILSSPVYHGTISGALKNAVDYLQALSDDERPWLTGKAAALMAVGTPVGGAHAISAMDHFCRALRATTVPTAIVTGPGFLGEDGTFTDALLAERISRMIRELAAHARLGLDEPGVPA
ncbi:NAD(P)H-dependent oxidoreductase [Kitasatospora sp. NBC_00085]|uniref:NADPH-dependent FMN reductase n=1 Tax=Kitasatospora sp. NBC_00085 TaxID=2903566 RepID=UPI003246F5D7